MVTGQNDIHGPRERVLVSSELLQEAPLQEICAEDMDCPPFNSSYIWVA